MTFATRISRIFKADMHGILDNIEGSTSVLKQAIREMEEELLTMEDNANTLKQKLLSLTLKLDYMRQDKALLQDDIAIAFKVNKENLVKDLVKKKLYIELKEKNISKKIQLVNNQEIEHKRQYQEYKCKHSEIKEKVESLNLIEHNSSIEIGERRNLTLSAVSQSDIDIEFLKQKERWLEGSNQ